MDGSTALAWGVAVLILARWLVQIGLERLNRRHIRSHGDRMPDEVRDLMDESTFRRSIAYTSAKSRFEEVAATVETGVLIGLLYSGLLPWGWGVLGELWGRTAWSGAAFLLGVGIVSSFLWLPLDWYRQFRLEERFGFNTTTAKLWWSDQVKGWLLSLLLLYPLVVLLLKLVDWTGAAWWFYGWLCVIGFQVVMLLLAPAVLLPLFNRFTPLPEGSLRDRLLELAERTGFRARSIQVMDGSRRSRHSNAFFTGLGRFRKIVLFDTLVEALREQELEAVLAHEIGHFKKGHILKLLVLSAGGALIAFYVVAWLAQQAWFFEAFGFDDAALAPALLVFWLLVPVVTFWLGPIVHGWSRQFEHEADAFAKRVVGREEDLIRALRQLTEQNLSNPVPHPLYSRFYYSHPTLFERERALREA